MNTALFPDRPRVDAHEKVMGRTQYAADICIPGMLFAMTVPATIAKGRVASLSVVAALRVPGVVRVFTAADFSPPKPSNPPPQMPPPPMLIEHIAYRGQLVALVVAETLEAAIEGAEAIHPEYAAASAFSPLMDSPGAERETAKPVTAGDTKHAMAHAATRHKDLYLSPAQHHNPMELLGTVAVWENEKLTVYEGTQGSNGVKNALVQNLELDSTQVIVKSPQIGGAFGQKARAQMQTSLVARAAILLGHPVKLVLPRGQVFHNAVFRPESRHLIELGADATDRMIAIDYEADQQQSRRGQFPPEYHEATTQMYGVTNYNGNAANVRIDTQGPGYMRCPYPHPASFALESAVDELIYKLNEDAVAFRLKHDTRTDPLNGHPLSSRFLNECITEGARRFGWERRSHAPCSMTLPDGTQLGWGMACGAYPVVTHPTITTLQVCADGATRFTIAAHEMGQGIRSTIEQVLLRELAIDPAKLEILIGDTSVAPQHLTAGSWGTASVVPGAVEAARKLKAALAELLAGRQLKGNLHIQLAAISQPCLSVEVSYIAPGHNNDALDQLRAGERVKAGPEYPEFTTFSYVAHFVEVHVEPRTRRVRVPRVVSIADCGRVISPRTAESQMRGGVVWGISAALREETEVDPRYGGWLNNDLADYVVAVNADIGDIDVGFVDEPDPLINALGVKGLGEVAMSGVSAAVANAVYHATGKRVREMPIRIEDLL